MHSGRKMGTRFYESFHDQTVIIQVSHSLLFCAIIAMEKRTCFGRISISEQMQHSFVYGVHTGQLIEQLQTMGIPTEMENKIGRRKA